MSHFSHNSKASYISNLDLFSVPPTDISLINSDFVQILPTNSVKDNYLITFRISESSAQNVYYDFNSSYLYLKAKILNNDKTSISEGAEVAFSSLFFYSCFKNCQILMQGKCVSDSNMMYSYRAFLSNLLGKSQELKESEMSQVLFYPDNPPDLFTDLNLNYKKRKEMSKKSVTFDALGKISSSVFENERFFPPGINYEIILTKNDPSFCLDSSTSPSPNYIFSIEEAVFYLKTHVISNEVLVKHNQAFSKGEKAIYNLRNLELRHMSIPVGTSIYSSEQLFGNKKPNLVVVAIVSTKAFAGDYNKSPQNFSTYGVCSINIKSEESIPLFQEFKVDYESNLYLNAYNSIFNAVGNGILGNGITREQFKNGNVFYLFQITPGGGQDQILPQRTGPLRLNIQFTSSTTETLEIIVLGSFDNLLSIDKFKNINIDN